MLPPVGEKLPGIVLVHVGGKLRARTLANARYGLPLTPAFSIDGRELFVMCVRPEVSVCAVSLETGRLRRVVRGPVLAASLSPDGRSLLVSRPGPFARTRYDREAGYADRQPHSSELVLVSLESGSERQVTGPYPWGISQLSFSPDGRRVFFSCCVALFVPH
jgi:Tol biopolymer transport system component